MQAPPPARLPSVEQLARPVSQAGSYGTSDTGNGLEECDAGLSVEEQLAALERSPFIDLSHPVTLYEAVKLALMAPVVALKASMQQLQAHLDTFNSSEVALPQAAGLVRPASSSLFCCNTLLSHPCSSSPWPAVLRLPGRCCGYCSWATCRRPPWDE